MSETRMEWLRYWLMKSRTQIQRLKTQISWILLMVFTREWSEEFNLGTEKEEETQGKW